MEQAPFNESASERLLEDSAPKHKPGIKLRVIHGLAWGLLTVASTAMEWSSDAAYYSGIIKSWLQSSLPQFLTEKNVSSIVGAAEDKFALVPLASGLVTSVTVFSFSTVAVSARYLAGPDDKLVNKRALAICLGALNIVAFLQYLPLMFSSLSPLPFTLALFGSFTVFAGILAYMDIALRLPFPALPLVFVVGSALNLVSMVLDIEAVDSDIAAALGKAAKILMDLFSGMVFGTTITYWDGLIRDIYAGRKSQLAIANEPGANDGREDNNGGDSPLRDVATTGADSDGALQQELEVLRQNLETMGKKVEDQSAKLVKSKGEVTAVRKENEALKRDNAEKDEKLREQEQRVAELVDKHEQAMKEAQATINDLRMQVSSSSAFGERGSLAAASDGKHEHRRSMSWG